MSPTEWDFEVLVVEDHEPTARLVSRVLEERHDSLSTHVAPDGETCLDILETDEKMPDLVLLDLELPGIDGHTVLQRRQEELSIRRVPTIIFSNADDRTTIRKCYEQGATAFISKPCGLEEYDTIVDQITRFWFRTVILPRA